MGLSGPPPAVPEAAAMEDRDTPLTGKLVEGLYTEAMLLADEARSHFDAHGHDEREALSAGLRLGYAVESLKVTTRIMHVVAWLLTQRAVLRGELTRFEGATPDRRLGRAEPGDAGVIAQLPEAARRLVEASEELYGRVARLEAEMLAPPEPKPSPARALWGQLERAF
ncbi:MAG: DUF1465 family protein [Parasphingopyxis sp.]|nr:DUF1465 family protein [Sphingomonadales bacterium]